MAAMASRLGVRLAQQAARAPAVGSSRAMHATRLRSEVTKFAMPAMSPTMTEGGLATWKVKEGQAFSAGDVLLEIETDKATMDVEAQEDGIMAKIVVEAGAKGVQVGKTIAMLAEEGDDISNVQVPADDAPAASASKAKEEPKEEISKGAEPSSTESHSSQKNSEQQSSLQPSSPNHAPDLGRTLFPSVARLLIENKVSKQDAQKIKGTGVRGMLTKGDVLSFLGQASSPSGSYKEQKNGVSVLGGVPTAGTKNATPQKPAEPLDGNAVRNLIFGGLSKASHASRAKANAVEAPSQSSVSVGVLPRRSAFDELLNDYEFGSKSSSSPAAPPQKKQDTFAGLL